MLKFPNSLYWLWFSLIPRVGAIKGKLLLGSLTSPEKLWHKDALELERIKSLGGSFCQKVVDENIRNAAIRLHDRYVKSGFIKMVSLYDEDYPKLLKEIPDPPFVLFYRGDIECCNDFSIGIIGSRKATSYGINCVNYLAKDLVKAGVVIVSGMARGIDSAAHEVALMEGGKTCAVLGCGPDIVYPYENRKLMESIIENGVVISEYPPQTKPYAQNFPARNRIISGVSNGLLVIEAGSSSGTLITADFALEQGRDVFSVPGNIFSEQCEGTNKLLKQGAILVRSSQDIFQEYSFMRSFPREKKEYVVTGLKRELLNLIKNGISSYNDIIERYPDNIPNVMAELTILESDGIIKKLPSGEYFLVSVI